MIRTLRKETSSARRKYVRLSATDRQQRLEDPEFLGVNGNLGRHLFLLAAGADDLDPDNLLEKLSNRVKAEGNGKPAVMRSRKPSADHAPPKVDPEKELVRLRKRIQNRDRKIRENLAWLRKLIWAWL